MTEELKSSNEKLLKLLAEKEKELDQLKKTIETLTLVSRLYHSYCIIYSWKFIDSLLLTGINRALPIPDVKAQLREVSFPNKK